MHRLSYLVHYYEWHDKHFAASYMHVLQLKWHFKHIPLPSTIAK